jgi:ribosomal protein S3AE
MVEKKRFFDIDLEVLDISIPLFAMRVEELENKVVNYDLTKFLKGKNCEARFLLKKKDDKIMGEMFSFKVHPSFIRRMIGHSISIVEDSFVVKSQDKDMRIKPFLITRKRVHRSVRNALRKECRKIIEKFVSEDTSDKIFRAVVSSVLQRSLSKKLKKIYPLAVCELRVVELVKKR